MSLVATRQDGYTPCHFTGAKELYIGKTKENLDPYSLLDEGWEIKTPYLSTIPCCIWQISGDIQLTQGQDLLGFGKWRGPCLDATTTSSLPPPLCPPYPQPTKTRFVLQSVIIINASASSVRLHPLLPAHSGSITSEAVWGN